ncbi:MAG TPA: FAD-dependent oxidoreductase [Verrucomicrobiae bacterium]|nr:FAD-dependent oxidoreductase [Verrucomicrobiae bacterium]
MSVAVVGAGVTGLTIARRLSDAGQDVCVFDGGNAGGLASGFEFPGVHGTYLERFYHHIFRTDKHVIDLIREHGLESDLLWRHSRPGLYAGGRIWPLESPLDLLRCRPVGGLLDRLKMGWNLRTFQKTPDWRPFDSITCEEFFRRHGNLRGYQGLWEPLLKAKFGDAYANTPAAFLWGRIYPRSRSREGGKECLGYLRGGFQRLMVAVVEKLEKSGVEFRLGTKVERIDRTGRGDFALSAGGKTGSYDRLVWTGHPGDLTRLLFPEDGELKRRASQIQYIGACCLVLLLDKPLGTYYWINNLDPAITFGGVIEHTNLVDPRDYGGRHIAYVINYLASDHPQLALDADEVFRLHLPSLRKLYPSFDESTVRDKLLFKSTRASPLYDRAFLLRMPPFTGWSKGIGLLGMPQVYPMDRNMNHCVEVALQADLNQLLS